MTIKKQDEKTSLDCITEENLPPHEKVVSMTIKEQNGIQQDEKTFPRVESFPWLHHHRGYLRNMRFRRGSSVHRGAFLNIHRYKLKASSCPDIYRNSFISLPKDVDEVFTSNVIYF